MGWKFLRCARLIFVAVLILSISAFIGNLSGQARAVRVVVGRILDAQSGVGIDGVAVTVRGASRSQRVVSSNGGAFTISGLVPGDYLVQAAKAGYIDGGYGQREPSGSLQALHVDAAFEQLQVAVRLWKCAVLAGEVSDEAGDPVAGLSVEALVLAHGAAGPQLLTKSVAVTDDRGSYRFSTLAAGIYIVALPSPFPRHTDHSYEQLAPLYYPGSRSVDAASPVSADPGAELSGIDFKLDQARAVAISGHIVSIPGEPLPSSPLTVIASPLDSGDVGLPISWISKVYSLPDGQFALWLARGRHVLRIDAPPASAGSGPTSAVEDGDGKITLELQTGSTPIIPAASALPTLIAQTPVTVTDEPLNDLSLALTHGGRISGRFEFNGTQPSVQALSSSYVSVISLEGHNVGSISPARIEQDGTFLTAGLPDGAYELSWTLPGSWFFRKMSGPVNASHAVIDVTHDSTTSVVIQLASTGAKLGGYVRGSDGTVRPDAFIYAFAANPAARFGVSRSMVRAGEFRPATDGHYTLSGLIPGEYFVVACSVPVTDWQSADVIAVLQGLAQRIQIDGNVMLDLTVINSPHIRK